MTDRHGIDNREELFRQILCKYWGYQDFRGIQHDIITSIAQGHDTLGLMPTGGGKSITFQVPAIAMEGVCIVITPLIALMKDQVHNLRRRGIIAAAIHSGMTRQEIVATLENCILGNTKLLYVSPERIATDIFKVKLARMKVSFITVDEAHCISQWGYDFRPSYLHIADIRHIKPDAPVLALTATATKKVADDIMLRLGFNGGQMFRMSFERKNLAYIVRKTMNKADEMVHILKSTKGSAIVYVMSRKHAEEISKHLNGNDIDATYYHAGLAHSTKDERQKAWHRGETRVMVATNAFGMGIDKPDVRTVIHYDCPNSLEAYFQEAGRAGRDGDKAYAVLLYNDSDQRTLKRRVDGEFPPKEQISEIYEHIAYFFQIATGSGRGHTFAFDIDKFCRTFKHYPPTVEAALGILQKAGYVEYDSDPDAQARLRFLLDRDQLYRLNGNTPHDDAVITALLRRYTGLFVDYCYIDEDYIATTTGLNRQQVYLILKSLSLRRIIHFIPQRKTPLLTYTEDRVDAELLAIPHDIYEKRKEQSSLHILSVINYATNDRVCRSRQLLRYFDESQSCDCGQCDVCISCKKNQTEEDNQQQAQQAIMQFLADGGQHHVSQLLQLNIRRETLGNALEYLIHEQAIYVEDGFLHIPKSKKNKSSK